MVGNMQRSVLANETQGTSPHESVHTPHSSAAFIARPLVFARIDDFTENAVMSSTAKSDRRSPRILLPTSGF